MRLILNAQTQSYDYGKNTFAQLLLREGSKIVYYHPNKQNH